MAQSAVEQAAERAWNDLSDRTDARMLDQLIERYPNTETAKLAFLTRYFLLTQNPTIEGYNAFLAKYPQKFQSQMALQEVFNLYREQNRAAAWLDFLRRYPDTHQGLAAKLHLQTLMAQFAMLCDDEDTYDDFIGMFPDAPQIEVIMKLAENIAVAREKKEFDAKYTTNELRQQRANVLFGMWEDLCTDLNKVYPDKTAPIIENAEAFLLATRIHRYRKALEPWRAYDAIGRFRLEERHQELMAKLDSIQQTLINNHRELVRTIRDEAAETRRVLREEFTRLGIRMDAGFEMLRGKMDVLHNDLVLVYQELQKVNVNLENINAEIQRSNLWLERMDRNLDEVQKTLVDGFIETGRHLVELGNKVDNVANEVANSTVQIVSRLNVMIDQNERSYNLQVEQFKVAVENLEVSKKIVDGQEVLIWQGDQLIARADQNLEKMGAILYGQKQTLHAINGVANEVRKVGGDVRNMHSSLQAFRNETNRNFALTNRNMQTGFANVSRSIYDVGNGIIQSNQQTIRNIQAQQQRPPSRSSGGFKGFLGKALPIAGTAIGTVFGGPVGGAIGATVGSALGTAAMGGSKQEIIGSAINTVINSGVGLATGQQATYPNSPIPLPPAQQFFDIIVDQGKTALKEEIVSQIGNKLPPEAIPLINSMLNANFEQRKALAIKSIASMLPSGVPQSSVQRILSARNEQELRNTLGQIARENALNLSAVMYAMDYIL